VFIDRRELDFDRAFATITYQHDGVCYLRELSLKKRRIARKNHQCQVSERLRFSSWEIADLKCCSGERIHFAGHLHHLRAGQSTGVMVVQKAQSPAFSASNF
jgi:hypothetical protein